MNSKLRGQITEDDLDNRRGRLGELINTFFLRARSGLYKLIEISIVRQRPVVHKSPWQYGEYAPRRITVVSRHARMRPDQRLMLSIKFFKVLILNVLPDIDRIHSLLTHLREARRNVA